MKILEQITTFLIKKNIEVESSFDEPIEKRKFDKLFNTFYKNIHSSIKEHYTQESNGFNLHWETDNDCGDIEFDSVNDIKESYEEFQNHVQFIINEVLDNCIEKPYKNKAIKIVGQMKNWSPLKYEGNGDSIVLELNTGKVLYNSHDWYDGFGTLKTTNGHLVAESLNDYISKWGNYCFIDPEVFMDDQIFDDQKIEFNDKNYNNEYKIENS